MHFPVRHKIKTGTNHDFGFTTKSGFLFDIQVNTAESLSARRTRQILGKLKHLAHTEKLDAVDSDVVGDKHTNCNWGFCTEDAEVYSDPSDHKFPYDFLNDGRTAPLPHAACRCPFDKREGNNGNSGCFHHCRIFKGPMPSQFEAMELFKIRIAEVESQLHESTASQA